MNLIRFVGTQIIRIVHAYNRTKIVTLDFQHYSITYDKFIESYLIILTFYDYSRNNIKRFNLRYFKKKIIIINTVIAYTVDGERWTFFVFCFFIYIPRNILSVMCFFFFCFCLLTTFPRDFALQSSTSGMVSDRKYRIKEDVIVRLSRTVKHLNTGRFRFPKFCTLWKNCILI